MPKKSKPKQIGFNELLAKMPEIMKKRIPDAQVTKVKRELKPYAIDLVDAYVLEKRHETEGLSRLQNALRFVYPHESQVHTIIRERKTALGIVANPNRLLSKTAPKTVEMWSGKKKGPSMSPFTPVLGGRWTNHKIAFRRSR